MMKVMRSWAKKDAKKESGQNTVEYVLLLFFVVVAVKTAGGTLKTKLTTLLDQTFGKVTEAVNTTNE